MRWFVLIALTAATTAGHAQTCGTAPLQVQILGSGGPELTDARAAPSILVWINGKPHVLVDAGPSVAARFTQVGASMNDVTSDVHLDTLSGNAGFNGLAVTLRRADEPVKKTTFNVVFLHTLFSRTVGGPPEGGHYVLHQ